MKPDGILSYGAWIVTGTVILLAIWEMFRPMAPVSAPTAKRWGIHFVLFLTSSAVQHLLPGLAALVLVAVIRPKSGLLHHASIPPTVSFLLTVAALDFAGYWRHRLCHIFLPMWKLHILHHSDRDLDFTSAFRFHPFEVALTSGIQSVLVLALAPRPAVVVASLLCFSIFSLYEHANITLPRNAERILSFVVFTPALHRFHHSQDERAQQRNFGEIFVVWDRLFGTFQPASSVSCVETGLHDISTESSLRIRHIVGAPLGR